MPSTNSAIVLLSGGLDSTTLLHHLKDNNWTVEALTVAYGQRHHREISAARAVAKYFGIAHTVCRLDDLHYVMQGSSQTDINVAVPYGHYADPSMKVTVVPNRNMIMLSVAAAAAISRKMSYVAYAAHAGDHAIYPDCRPLFIDAMKTALRLCHYDNGVQLYAPFAELSKAGVVRVGKVLGTPYHLTYSCYEGEAKHCGRCGTCVERLEAFAAEGMTDSVEYS